MYRSPIGLTCALVVAAATAPAAPVPTHLMPKDPPLYFPTTVGARWVYEANKATTELVVTRAERVDGGTLVTVECEQGNGKTTPYHKILVSRSGLAMTEEGGEGYVPYWELLRLPHRASERWTSAAERGDLLPTGKRQMVLRGEATDCGEETIRVPAGTFRALRVDKDWTLNGRSQGRSSKWFAAGVGIVKYEWPDGVRELKSFEPAPKKK
jgi:hypothetical protein